MKLVIEKGDLQRGLARLQAIVEKRNSMPILANVLITASGKGNDGRLELAATDLEVGIRGSQAANISKPGSVTVSARKFYDIVRELPDEPIQLQTTSTNYLEIRSGRARFSLAGTDAEEYPSLPDFSPGKLVRLQAAVLGQMIERTMYAASADETRYNLNGVYFEVIEAEEKIRMVATDGHRLALVDRVVGSNASGLASGVIIPRKGLAELKRLVDEEDADEVEIGFEGNSGLARKGDVTLVMRLIEGEFPNYRQVVPDDINRVFTLAAEPLTRALRRVALLSAERSRAIKIDLSEGNLTISSSNPDLGEATEELDFDYAGDPVSLGFNARYLLDALSALGAKEIRLGLREGSAAVDLRPTDDQDSVAVVMPMRL
ncbi:MAG: DNA polymerase III subunit beta [Deltaproteobacteria bacterium]|jgi:DNA polymerase-3 subunit beta|nr:DNA polymerase III subunit beta [Deltaproteobacteria bacterium]